MVVGSRPCRILTVYRDTLEQIDVARGVIDKYPDTFQLALTASDVETAIRSGKIASLLGVEGCVVPYIYIYVERY